MDALHAHSPAEAEYYLKVTPCPGCAKGPWEIQVRRPEQDARSMSARCQNCHIERRFEFFCPEQDPAEANPEGDVINASDEPSRIIDVGQWLSLFFFLIDSAAKSPEKAETRKISFQAAQCLDEALKFYTPNDDLPLPSAFFVDTSREAMSRFPERFKLARLRELRSKLPDFHTMARRVADDLAGVHPPKKVKWRPWRK